MSTKILVLIGLGAIISIFGVMQVTAPATIHPAGLLGFFVLLYIVSLVTITIGLMFVTKLTKAVIKIARPDRYSPEMMTYSRAYMYSTMLAFAPVILIAMRSVGAFGAGDIALVIVLELLACFYVWRRQ